MKRMLGGVILGLGLAGLAGAILLPRWQDEHYEMGVRHGRIEGRLEAIETLEERLGTHPRAEDRRTIFEAKTSELVLVTVAGVETVRAVRP